MMNMNRSYCRNEYDFIKFIMLVNPETRIKDIYFSECMGRSDERTGKFLVLNSTRISTALHYNHDDDNVTICLSYNLDKNPHNVYIFEVEFKDFLHFNSIYKKKGLALFEPFSFNTCLEHCLNNVVKGLNDYPLCTMTRHC